MKFRIIAAALAFALGSSIAHAAPTLISYGDINLATLEDFESISVPSDLGQSTTFTGFDYGANDISVINCQAGPDSSNCLSDGDVFGLGSSRVFDNFDAGTIAIGFEIDKLLESDNLTATVDGASGPAVTFFNIGSGLIGFLDPRGLTSVTFNNLGQNSGSGNYRFDDVITGTTVVPLPAGLPLLAGGLLALGLIRRRASAG